MKCSKCGEIKETVGDVRQCGMCYDGTAQQIPADLADSAPITDAIAAREGLGNRFKPATAATEPNLSAAPPPGIVTKANQASIKRPTRK